MRSWPEMVGRNSPRWCRQAFGLMRCAQAEEMGTSSAQPAGRRIRADEGSRRPQEDIYDEDIEALVDQEIPRA